VQLQTKRWRIATLILVCAAVFAALVVFQSVAAIQQQQEPIPLQPPFAFQADAPVSASDYVPLPMNATRLLTETFGSGFNPTVGVTGTTTAWRVFTDTGSIATSYWARVIPALSSTYQDTAWAPCGQCDGSNLDPDTDNYPANVGTWLIYGPVNLTDYYAAEAVFRYQLDAHPAADGGGTSDFFGAGVSDDGIHFSGFQLTGDLIPPGWLTGTLNLADHAGKSSVYIGFYFHSNGDSNRGQGAFIDNVSLRAAPFLKTYMPSLAKNFSVATPTPQSLYNFTFAVGGANDPDFVAWGRDYHPGTTPPFQYEQGMVPNGNPNNAMYVYNTQTNLVTMAGPDPSVYTSPTNYEINVDFSVVKSKTNARYGVVFGAGSGTFGRNGSLPTFNINTNYYKFGLQFANSSDNIPDEYQLERCDGDGGNCVKLVVRSPLPGNISVDGVWDNFTIRRQGSSIVVLINGVQFLSVTDGTYTGARRFGMFIQAADFNNTSNPLEINFDNYRVTQLP
jgi:hypothetical protein